MSGRPSGGQVDRHDETIVSRYESRLFGSPEFRSVYGAAYDRVRAEITRQEARLLKPGGILIHSDADGRAQGRR